MSSFSVANTAQALSDAAPLPRLRLRIRRARPHPMLLLDGIVAWTEAAQRHLARSAAADARAGGLCLESPDRFVSDAAGGGSRCIEAARSLDAGQRR